MDKKLKVFQFIYEVDSGDGLMLICADNLDEAIEIANQQPVGFGRWEQPYEFTNLFCTGPKGVITERSYAE